MRTRLAVLLALLVATLATGPAYDLAGSGPAGAVGAHDDQLALQGIAKRPTFDSERRQDSRQAGGKGAVIATLPVPLDPIAFVPIGALAIPCSAPPAPLLLDSRLSRGPPALRA